MPKKVTQIPPSEAELAGRLGKSLAAYQSLLEGNPDLRPEWKYYGPRTGWTLKLFDRRRNLCFVSPGEGNFVVAFLLGERAVSEALASELPEKVKSELSEARQYVEGRPVRVVVKTARDLTTVVALLRIKRGA